MTLHLIAIAAQFAAAAVLVWFVVLTTLSTFTSLFYSFRRTPLASSKPLVYSSAPSQIDYFRAPKRGKDTNSDV